MKTKHDDGLERLRKIRRQMAKQFDYDPKKAGEYYRRMRRPPGMKLYKRDEHLAGAE